MNEITVKIADTDTLLLLARELEWAEAYALDFPECALGAIYLNLLQCEIAHLQ